MASAVAPAWGQAEHPRLVKLESTTCTVCHDDILKDLDVVHPVTDDCTSCHEVSIAESGTTVALMDQEPALCLICHDHLEAAVNADLDTPHYPVTESCLGCHDPHATEHPKLLTDAQTELCATCHDTDGLAVSHGEQLTPVSKCSGCHQPHGSDNPRMLAGSNLHAPFAEATCNACHREPFGDRIRLRSRGERLCESCHGDLSEEAGEHGSVHAALVGSRGRAGCLSCHNPHMSSHPTLLVESGTRLCGTCHAEVVAAAEAETGHFAAADDCLNCHRPHAAGEPALLNEATAELCDACHDPGDEDLSATHLGADLSALDCVSCHSPHGSGHPSLLAEYLHAPVLDGCDTCHEGAVDRLMDDGESSLCLMCHDDIGEVAASAEVPHGALELARCVDCHNPHASPQASLVKAPSGEVCADCHDEQVAGDGEVAHGVIDRIGCQACHEPHGGGREKLLRAGTDELCVSCHDPQRLEIPEDGGDVLLLGRFPVTAQFARTTASLRLSADGDHGHPLAGHRVLGTPSKSELKKADTDFEGELTCLTCHDPHKGRSSGLFRWGAATSREVCANCHKK